VFLCAIVFVIVCVVCVCVCVCALICFVLATKWTKGIYILYTIRLPFFLYVGTTCGLVVRVSEIALLPGTSVH
jgi:hypothetical protein